ncbi:MAG: hypothetical protein PHT58_03885 [Eubacteriales bacterium]|nr:hypothetical protein [Eubacteriales bacterium]
MVRTENRKMTIPYEEKNLGYEGDNAVAVRVFGVTDLSLSGYVFKLDIQKSNGDMGVVALEKVVDNETLLLTWTLLESELDTAGALTVQLRAYNENGTEIWHSGKGVFIVGSSINAADEFGSPLPSEFAEFERRVTQAVALVEEVSKHIGDIATGADGKDGQDGVSVTGAAVNEQGRLIVTLSSGVTMDCGYVVGPRGADGLPGVDGLPGKDGRPGVDGQPGADAVVDYDAINTTISNMLTAKLQSVDALPAEPLPDVIYFIRE